MADGDWRGMDRAALSRAYDNSGAVAGSSAFMAALRERSAAFRDARPGELDIPYGDGPRQRFALFRWGKAGARPKAYLQASIHANELPGAMAIHHLAPMLDAAERKGQIKGEIVVLPHCNPIGLSQLVGNTHSGRYEHLGRENFNRNYPDLFAPVAEMVSND